MNAVVNYPTISQYPERNGDGFYYRSKNWVMCEEVNCKKCGCCGSFCIFNMDGLTHLASVSYCADYASRYAALERALALLEQEDVTKFTEEERVATK